MKSEIKDLVKKAVTQEKIERVLETVRLATSLKRDSLLQDLYRIR